MAPHDPFSVPFPLPAPPKGRRRSTDGLILRVNGSSVGRFLGGKGLRRQVNSGKEFRERGGFRGTARASFGGGRRGPAGSSLPPTLKNRTAGSPVYAGKPPRREPGRGAARPKPHPAYAGKSARKSSQPRSSVSRGASTPFSISEMAAARGSIVARHEVSSGSSAFSPVRSATKRR